MKHAERPAQNDFHLRRCTDADVAAMLAIVNDAAQAYRGIIPADRWHEPYMPEEELRGEIAAGVVFWGAEAGGRLAGVMGLQDVQDVALIRHAYVATADRGKGTGGELLRHLLAQTDRPILVGTWAAATWAIRFYEQHGFALTSQSEKERPRTGAAGTTFGRRQVGRSSAGRYGSLDTRRRRAVRNAEQTRERG